MRYAMKGGGDKKKKEEKIEKKKKRIILVLLIPISCMQKMKTKQGWPPTFIHGMDTRTIGPCSLIQQMGTIWSSSVERP